MVSAVHNLNHWPLLKIHWGALIYSASIHQENYLFKQNYLVHWIVTELVQLGICAAGSRMHPFKKKKKSNAKKLASVMHKG